MTKLKKHLSVFSLFARSSIYKVLLILLAMCTVEIIFFHFELRNALKAYEVVDSSKVSLEQMFMRAATNVYFRVALVLVSIVICLPGCSFKSKTSYTLCRLSVRECITFFYQAAYNTLVYLVLIGVQLIVAFGLSRYYVAAAPAKWVSNQTITLAFYRNNFLHSLLPLDDIGLWIRNGLLILSLGLSTAEYPYKQRRHQFSATAIALGIYIIVYFDQSIGQLTHVISCSIIALVIIGEVIYNLTRKDKEVVRYD